MSSRFCTHCGGEVAIGESHCMECGKKLPDSPPPSIETREIPNQEVSTDQEPVMFPFNPYQQKPQNGQIQASQKSDSFGHFNTNQQGPQPPRTREFASQPFIIYLLGVFLGKNSSLKMEFQSNSSKNSILLFLLLAISNYFIYTAFFNLFPFFISQEFFSELMRQSFFNQGLSLEINEQSFKQIFALSGLLTYPLGNIIFGTLALSILFNSNRLPNSYKKAFIVSVASLIPIIAIELLRYIAEATLFIDVGNQTVFLIANSTDLADYLSIIFNSNLGHNPGLRIILLSLRMGWTAILMQKLFSASGLLKEKTFFYTLLFTLFVGGGFDLLSQMFYFVN